MPRPERPLAVLALLATAIVTGALAGLGTSAFIWAVEQGTELVWTDLPERVGVDPYASWWLFAIPIGAAVVVGLGQRYLGPHPMPLEHAIATWRRGESLPPSTAPKTFANSLVILLAGGPVGFEAALTGIVGGSASWISGRIGATGRLVRQAWGAEQIDDLPDRLRTVPYWLAAVAGLVAYRSSPLGGIDMGFRYERFGGDLTGTEIAVAFAFATAVTVPSAWALAVVTRAEEAPWSQRWPIPAAVAGAVVFCLLAVGHEFVLFSGQQAIQHLEGLSTSTLVYLAVAKWLALVVALLAGWRGGPIFPMYLAIAATAVAVADGLDVRTDVVVIAGIGALGVILLKGNVAGSLILSLYVAPLSYTGVVLVGAVAGASMLVVGRAAGLLPAPPEDEGQSSSASSSRRSRLRMRSPVSPK